MTDLTTISSIGTDTFEYTRQPIKVGTIEIVHNSSDKSKLKIEFTTSMDAKVILEREDGTTEDLTALFKISELNLHMSAEQPMVQMSFTHIMI